MDTPVGCGLRAPAWLAEGATLPGSALEHTGLRAPTLFPEQMLLIGARAVP